MRILSLFLALSLLFCGCAAVDAAPATENTLPVTEQTLPPTVPTTLPPDPMQMLLDAMTVEEKVGQLFLARCPAENAVEDIKRYHLGGYILFGQDIDGQTPDSLKQKIADYQAASPIPLLIAVDEEGGTVCRISSNPAFRSTRFPSPRELYNGSGMEAVMVAEWEKNMLLQELGIQVNMAPVCDISTDPAAFMYRRSLGQSPEETARFAAEVVTLMANYKVGSVAKHFPGYGNNPDTHTGICVDSRPLEVLEGCDLIPFEAAIAAGCDAILVSHTIVSAMDDSLPASLSVKVHDYLRRQMGFEGVIITDDLVMQAITDTYGAEEAAVLAVLAGNDLLCSTEYAVQYAAVLQAVRENRISMELLDQAVTRVLEWKQELGLIF